MPPPPRSGSITPPTAPAKPVTLTRGLVGLHDPRAPFAARSMVRARGAPVAPPLRAWRGLGYLRSFVGMMTKSVIIAAKAPTAINSIFSNLPISSRLRDHDRLVRRVGDLRVLAGVDASDLVLVRDPQAHRHLDAAEDERRGYRRPADDGDPADQLRDDLAAVAVDQARHPEVGAAGDDADREHAPEAGEHGAGPRPHRVVQLHDALEETGAVDHDRAGDAADDHRRPGLDEGAGGRARHQAAEDAGARRGGGDLAGLRGAG